MRNYFTRDRIIALALAGTAAPPLSQADRCAANAIRVIEATNRVYDYADNGTSTSLACYGVERGQVWRLTEPC